MKKLVSIPAAVAVAALVAVGVAEAQKPVVQLAPSPPGSLALANVPRGVLKNLAPLTTQQKLALIKPAQGAAPTERDLDSPIRINLRSPYPSPNAYLISYGNLGIDPSYEPPELLVSGDASGASQSNTSVRIVFRAEPSLTYLVDCGVRPGGSATSTFFTTVSTLKDDRETARLPATTAPPPDGHLSFVVRK
jgi:hypothetical protein